MASLKGDWTCGATMSSSSSTFLQLTDWNVHVLDVLYGLQTVGWAFRKPSFLYRPLETPEDDVDWRTADDQSLALVTAILCRQQAEGRTSGVQLCDHSLGASAQFVFTPGERSIIIYWGADCPRHSIWDRIVDPTWSLTVVTFLCRLLTCGVEVMRMEFFDPN